MNRAPGPARRRRPGKVSEWLAQEIVADIADQRLQPGTPLLSETETIERYQVSRGSVREAFRLLENLGVIAIRTGPGGGPVLAQVTANQFARTFTFYLQLLGVRVSDIVEARALLDPLLLRIATERADTRLRESLGQLVDGTEPVPVANSTAWSDHAVSFHGALVRATGNPVLDLFAGALQVLFTERAQVDDYDDNDRVALTEQHRAIAQAVLDGDADAAETLMRDHMVGVLDDVKRQRPNVLDEIVDWR